MKRISPIFLILISLFLLIFLSAATPLTEPTLNLGLVLTVLAGLVGLPALWSVIIDLLKFTGIVTDGNAGKWNAAFGLASLIMVMVIVNFFPNLDIGGTDKLLAEIAQFAGLLLSFLTQIFVAKGTHALTSRIVPAFSFSQRK